MSYTATLARQNNGYKTWGFSQGSPRVWIHYCGFSAGGICAALAAHWIKNHALDDYGLPKYLGLKKSSVGVGKLKLTLYGFLNISKVKEIGRDFYQWTTVGKRNNIAQRIGLRNWMDRNGMRRIQNGVTGDMNSDHMDYLFTQAPQQGAANNITHHLRRVKGAYAYISFGKFAGSGHATAIWLGGNGEDACFFDPNFGEFWFPNRDDFYGFFEAFHQKYYQKLSGRWGIETFYKKPGVGTSNRVW